MKHADLPFPLADCTIYQWFAEFDTGRVDHLPGLETVRSVQDNIVLGGNFLAVFTRNADAVRHGFHIRVKRCQHPAGAGDLGFAWFGTGMDDLPLQVGNTDYVIIRNANPADSGSGKIEERRRTQPACANNQDFGILQLLLACPTDFPEHNMARISRQFDRLERRCRPCCRLPRAREACRWTSCWSCHLCPVPPDLAEARCNNR